MTSNIQMLSDLVWIILGKLSLKERIKIMKFNKEMLQRYKRYPRIIQSYYALASTMDNINMDKIRQYLGLRIREVYYDYYRASSFILLRRCLGIKDYPDIDVLAEKYMYFYQTRKPGFTIKLAFGSEYMDSMSIETNDIKPMLMIAEHVGDINFIVAYLCSLHCGGMMLRRRDIMIPVYLKYLEVVDNYATIFVYLIDAGLFEEVKNILDEKKIEFVIEKAFPPEKHDWFIKYLMNRALNNQDYLTLVLGAYYSRIIDGDFMSELVKLKNKYNNEQLGIIIRRKNEKRTSSFIGLNKVISSWFGMK